jgi:hypothetical protein
MLNFLDSYQFIRGKKAFGVELIFNSKDIFTLIALELSSSKTGVEITRRFTDISFEELAKENDKKLPIYLAIGGKGIIHKKVKVNEHIQEQEILNQVLPNASIKDFYVQQAIISDHECWASVVRKDLLDDIIGQLINNRLFSVEIYLGPFILENTFPFINKSSIYTTTHELLIEDNNILQMDGLGSVGEGHEYTIESEIVNSHELMAFSAALSHFIPSTKLISINSDKVFSLKEEFLNKAKYRIVTFSIITFFFAVSIVNYLMYNSYQDDLNQMQYQLYSKKQYVDELSLLKQDFLIKEAFVRNSGLTQASKVSFCADQIAMSTPTSIQLDRLFVNPLGKRIKKAEDIQFFYNTIKIEGTVNKSIELNNWIKEIKELEWIEDIDVINYIQENLNTPGEFEIEIIIH